MALFLASSALAACGDKAQSGATAVEAQIFPRSCAEISDQPVRLAGGTFQMGDDQVYAGEGPVRETTVDGFWIDRHEVTNRQFAAFVEATGYVTTAEKPVDPSLFDVPLDQVPIDMLKPGSAVFTPPEQPSVNYADWWEYRPGANWKKPYGPHGPKAVLQEPAVHLSWADMQAYARWRGGRLPTEAEWEYAASEGKPSVREQPSPDHANSWQGVFPMNNAASDGFKGLAPVGCYRANSKGLYDMVGNVWEVTSDYFRPGHDPAQVSNPTGPSENQAYDPLNPGLVTRVMKGGSFLCAPNYCQRYRAAARQGRNPGLGASNVGFRLVYDRGRSAT